MVHINQEFYYKKGLSYKNIPDTDRLISGYIKAIGEGDYSEVLQFDIREEVRFHLGWERQSGISWYPFKEGAVILEVGGEFGAMTGALCDRAGRVVVTEPSLFRAASIKERYASRDNLEIYAGLADEMQFSSEFDYIIIVNDINFCA